MLHFMTLIKHLAAFQPSILFIFKNPYQNLTKTAHKFVFYSLAKLAGPPPSLQPDPSELQTEVISTPRSQAFPKPPLVLLSEQDWATCLEGCLGIGGCRNRPGLGRRQGEPTQASGPGFPSAA